jgi:hypothetical protein
MPRGTELLNDLSVEAFVGQQVHATSEVSG